MFVRCVCVCEVCVHVCEVCVCEVCVHVCEVLLSPGMTECDMMVELYMRCVCVCV